jgi:hypothetical protein
MDVDDMDVDDVGSIDDVDEVDDDIRDEDGGIMTFNMIFGWDILYSG